MQGLGEDRWQGEVHNDASGPTWSSQDEGSLRRRSSGKWWVRLARGVCRIHGPATQTCFTWRGLVLNWEAWAEVVDLASRGCRWRWSLIYDSRGSPSPTRLLPPHLLEHIC